MDNIDSNTIADFLKAEVYGENILIDRVSPIADIYQHCLGFSMQIPETKFLQNINNVCIIVSELPDFKENNTFIIVKDPKLAFIKVVYKFFGEPKRHSVIAPDLKCGKNVVINSGTIIGRGCSIGSNTVIGEQGFSFSIEEDGTPLRMPHLGNVVIGDFVEIGALNSITRGVLRDTVIHSHVKLDDLVHIAHNCIIRENCRMASGTIVGGSAVIGAGSFLGTGAAIKNQIHIGSNNLIGIGAVVIKDTVPNAVMVGNPARLLRLQ